MKLKLWFNTMPIGWAPFMDFINITLVSRKKQNNKNTVFLCDPPHLILFSTWEGQIFSFGCFAVHWQIWGRERERERISQGLGGGSSESESEERIYCGMQ